MRAFHNDPAVQSLYLSRIIQQATAKRIRLKTILSTDTSLYDNGQLWDGPIACALQGHLDYRLYEERLGIPK